ncbi:MAG: hypothetical protein KJ970_05560 [Candidatus Eisenbacteria bacterium]|uniref:Uncharacterized protein n=1 Tax=Eiseniibacteriota bacterium TaxID=2212470 RepID=A0A948RT37_UNCEI|nr:hypothetical protein [Candidatus Eisenbacteria bacterium]
MPYEELNDAQKDILEIARETPKSPQRASKVSEKLDWYHDLVIHEIESETDYTEFKILTSEYSALICVAVRWSHLAEYLDATKFHQRLKSLEQLTKERFPTMYDLRFVLLYNRWVVWPYPSDVEAESFASVVEPFVIELAASASPGADTALGRVYAAIESLSEQRSIDAQAVCLIRQLKPYFSRVISSKKLQQFENDHLEAVRRGFKGCILKGLLAFESQYGHRPIVSKSDTIYDLMQVLSSSGTLNVEDCLAKLGNCLDAELVGYSSSQDASSSAGLLNIVVK